MAFVLLWLPLAGCATSALDMAPERPDRPWAPATTASGEIIAGEALAGAAHGGRLCASVQPALGQDSAAGVVRRRHAYSLPD